MEDNLIPCVFMVMVFLFGVVLTGVSWYLSLPEEKKNISGMNARPRILINNVRGQLRQPHQSFFLRCSHVRCEFRTILVLTFSCPSYSLDLDKTTLNYEIWNQDKSESMSGSIKVSDFITDRNVKSLVYILIGSNQDLGHSLDCMKLWLSNPETDLQIRLFFFEITVLKERKSNDDVKIVYPIKTWVSKQTTSVDMKENNLKYVPRFEVPKMTSTDTAIILLTSVLLSCFSSFFVIWSSVEKKSCNSGVYLISLLYGFIIELLFSCSFISWFRLNIMYGEAFSRFILGKETKFLRVLAIVFLVVLSVFLTAIVAFFGFWMTFYSSLYWMGVCVASNAVNIGIYFLVLKNDVWKRITQVKEKEKKREDTTEEAMIPIESKEISFNFSSIVSVDG